MIEPNCDMPWEVYLDWLQDQGNEDLRFIEYGSFITGLSEDFLFDCSSIEYFSGQGSHSGEDRGISNTIGFANGFLSVVRSGDSNLNRMPERSVENGDGFQQTEETSSGFGFSYSAIMFWNRL